MSNVTALNHKYLSLEKEGQDAPLDKVSLSQHVEAMRNLARALLREIERVKSTQLPDVEQGINFYQEVERFEINLIRSALERTGGHQTRAARLLGINITTLNHKIKRYKIELDEATY